MRILFIQNIPSPYRIDFFNELGKYCELTVLFEAKTTPFTVFNYNLDDIRHFRAIFLREDDIREKRVDWRVLRYIRKNAYDLVIATNYAYFTEAAAILALKARRIPYYLELDGGIVREEPWPVKAGKRLLMRGAEGYFSTSDGTDACLRHYCGEGIPIYRYPFSSLRAAELTHAPLSAAEKRALRAELGLPDRPLVLSVGKFTRRKGFDVLMDAAAMLKSEAELVIVGGEAGEEYLAQRERLGLRNLRFLSFMGKDALMRWYRAADVFAFATREDVWGLVVNEAMAQGLPVITTTACVAGTVLIQDGESGFLVPPEDAEALAARIDLLLENEALRTDMAQKALARAGEYTIERMAARHAEVLGLMEGKETT